MQCQEVRQLLSAYMDDRLETIQKQEVSDHLQECDACGAEFAELQRAMGLLRQLPELSPPPEFRTSLKKQISSGGVVHSSPRNYYIRRWTRFAAVAVVICLTLGIAAVMHGFPLPWAQKEIAQNIQQTESAGRENLPRDLEQGLESAVEAGAGEARQLSTGEKGEEPASSSPVMEAPGDPEPKVPGGEPLSNGDDQQVSIMALPPKDTGQKESTSRGDSQQGVSMTAIVPEGGEDLKPGEASVTDRELTLRVQDLEQAKTFVLDIMKNHAGELISEEQKVLKLRFPSSEYDKALIKIESAGEVIDSGIWERDISVEYSREDFRILNVNFKLQ